MKDIQYSPFENLQPQNPGANARRLILDLAKASVGTLSDRKETLLNIAESVAKELPKKSNATQK